VSATLHEVAAATGTGWVAMHMRGDPRTMQRDPRYADVVDEVRSFLVERAETAVAAGVGEVWIDPGIGFGKTVDHNLELLARLDELVATGFPVLLGTSRKRFLGVLMAEADGAEGPTPPGDRLEGSLATAVWATPRGSPWCGPTTSPRRSGRPPRCRLQGSDQGSRPDGRDEA
jgi:dihydropteroate synthase